MQLAVAPKPIMTLAPIVDVSYVRAWAVDLQLAEFFRRFPAIWSLTDDTIRSILSTTYYVREGEVPVGLISLTSFDSQSRKVEMGIAILPMKGRRVLAEQACCLLAEYVFDHLSFRKIVFQTLAHREDLKAAALSYGFKHEATLRDNCFWQGTYHDECVFGLLNEEFTRG